MKYNLSKIMLKAWEIYRKYNIKFSEALHRAWLSAKAEEVNAKRSEQKGIRNHRGYKYMVWVEKAWI